MMHCNNGTENKPPRNCPGCIDRKKDKEIVTLDRVTLQEFQNILIGELPLQFRQMKYSEIKTPYRIILKGSLGCGVVWNGRFEIYTMIENVIGQTCDIRIMETTRSRKESHILGYHKTAPMSEPILSYVLPGGEVVPVDVDGHQEGDRPHFFWQTLLSLTNARFVGENKKEE